MNRTAGVRPALLLIAVAAIVSACGSPPSPSGGHATARATARSTPATPDAAPASPAATAAVAAPPAAPLAVIYTDTDRSLNTYEVLLIGLDGRVVSSTTAHLPSAQPNQTLTLSPVSVGTRLAYYRDGSTEIHSLGPDGSTALVLSVPAASAAEMAFAVSPDETRIALALISEGQDPSTTTVHAATQDLAGGGSPSTLYSATGSDAYRWPVAWKGADIVLGSGSACGNGGLYNAQGVPQPLPCVSSIRTIAPDNGSAVATICEAPNPEPYGENDVRTLEGVPVAAGVACYAYTSQFQQGTSTCSLSAVSLTGGVSGFDACGPGASYLAEDSCFLAPDGSRMACLTSSSAEVAILTPGGHLRGLGRKAVILGWMDTTHLVVELDPGHLGVLDADTGALATVALSGAAHAAMAGVVTS